MRTRWISPQFVSTNRVDSAADYQELRDLGARVNAALGIGTSATHMEWFFGPKGLRFSEIGCRPPGVGAWDLYSAGNDIDLYREWANAIVHGHVAARPSRRFATGIVALRPDRDGQITGYSGVDEAQAPARGVGDRRAPAAAGHADPAGRGRLLGQRLRADAPPRLRRAARHARRRRPHRARARRGEGASFLGPAAPAHPGPRRRGRWTWRRRSRRSRPAGRSASPTTPSWTGCSAAAASTCGCTRAGRTSWRATRTTPRPSGEYRAALARAARAVPAPARRPRCARCAR